MKKFLTMGIALLSVMLFSCNSNEGTPAGDIEGTYSVVRTIEMRTPSILPFLPVTHNVKVTIKAQNESFVNITLPGATYTFEGQTMDLPTFTLQYIPVLDSGTEGVVIPSHDFSQKVGNKNVIGTVEGELEADGDLELDVEFKYGAMPYYMVQKYETPDNR